jgi:hypothetical protein
VARLPLHRVNERERFSTIFAIDCRSDSSVSTACRSWSSPIDAVVDGLVLIEADLGDEIDNMEGLNVHRTADGEIVLTLISDDNFSPVQRTLLLQFTLADP